MPDRFKVLIICPMSPYLGKDLAECVGPFRDSAEGLYDVMEFDAVLILIHQG